MSPSTGFVMTAVGRWFTLRSTEVECSFLLSFTVRVIVWSPALRILENLDSVEIPSSPSDFFCHSHI